MESDLAGNILSRSLDDGIHIQDPEGDASSYGPEDVHAKRAANGTVYQARKEKQMRRMFLAAATAIVTCMLGAPSFAQPAATALATEPPVRQCYPP